MSCLECTDSWYWQRIRRALWLMPRMTSSCPLRQPLLLPSFSVAARVLPPLARLERADVKLDSAQVQLVLGLSQQRSGNGRSLLILGNDRLRTIDERLGVAARLALSLCCFHRDCHLE